VTNFDPTMASSNERVDVERKLKVFLRRVRRRQDWLSKWESITTTVEFDHNGPDNGFDSSPGFVLTQKPFHVICMDLTK